MSTLIGLDQLAGFLTFRGLATEPEHPDVLHVSNPISARLYETVHHQSEQYVTDWGYSLGDVGDESGTADRIAFLLGVPSEQQRPNPQEYPVHAHQDTPAKDGR